MSENKILIFTKDKPVLNFPILTSKYLIADVIVSVAMDVLSLKSDPFLDVEFDLKVYEYLEDILEPEDIHSIIDIHKSCIDMAFQYAEDDDFIFISNNPEVEDVAYRLLPEEKYVRIFITIKDRESV